MARKKHLTVILLILSGLFFGYAAHAEVIVKCGALKGQSYFYPGPFVAEKDVGWQSDGISAGSTTIVMVDGEPDVLYGNATGGVFSSRAAGGVVTVLGITDYVLVIGVNYPKTTIEVYTWNAVEQTLMLFQSKYGAAINKVTLMRSHCG